MAVYSDSYICIGTNADNYVCGCVYIGISFITILANFSRPTQLRPIRNSHYPRHNKKNQIPHFQGYKSGNRVIQRVCISQKRVGREYFFRAKSWTSLVKIISHKNILKMENFSLDQIEQFLKIDQEILGSADHIIFSQKGIFDDIDGEGITLLTTKTQG